MLLAVVRTYTFTGQLLKAHQLKLDDSIGLKLRQVETHTAINHRMTISII